MQILTCMVRIEPAEEGGYDVYVPALRGYVTQDDIYEEAVQTAQEAIEGFVETLALAGEPAPAGPR